MNKHLFAASIAAVLVAMTSGFAMAKHVHPSSMSQIDSIIAVNNQFTVDFAYNHLDYLETDSSGPLDSERGWAPGVDLTLSTMGNWGIDNLYLSGHFRYVNGNSQYVGSFIGDPYGSLVQTDGAQILNEDLRIGKGFDVGGAMITPYLGGGARQWARNITGIGGYHEDYRYAYVGGGLLLQAAITDRLVLSANGLVGTTFSASMNTSYNGGFNVIPQTFQLGNSVILMAGASLDYAISNNFHTNVGVDVTDFRFGASPTGLGGYYEPDSHTTEVTAKIGFGYSF